MIDTERGAAVVLRVLANLFILFFICRSVFMCWPFDQHYNPRHSLRLLNKLSTFLALNADLALFSPNAPNVVDEVKFVIFFEDGTTGEWKFPGNRMLPWDSPNSYQQYIRNAMFWNDRHALVRLYKYEARYIARQVATSLKHPVRVYFYRACALVPPPEVGIGKPLIQAQNYHLIYSYLVEPGDLE